jgi:hypothetical protein
MDRITHTQKIGHSPEDSLIIHAIPAGSVTIASQAVNAGTLVITLNTGATVSLQGARRSYLLMQLRLLIQLSDHIVA